MKKTLTRVLTALLVICMVVSLAIPVMTASAAAKKPYQQWKGGWENHVYGGNTIGNTGCGLLSLINAVNYLTGNFMDVDMIATYAHSINAYNGTYGTGSMRNILYPAVSTQFGPTYGFTFDTEKWGNVNNATLKSQLANGYVAVAHVKNHFIALVGYNPSTDCFLVYDSAANMERRHTSENGDWLSTTFLCNGCVVGGVNYMKIDWWYTIRRTGSATTTTTTTTTSTTLYTVSASCNGNGKVHFGNNVTSAKVAAGTVINYQVTPNSGYKATSIKVGGTAQTIKNHGADTVYQFTMPKGNCAVEVVFSKIQTTPTLYKVNATVSSGSGKVHFGNNVTSANVAAGTVVNYQVTPSSGYKATSIKVGNSAVSIKNNGADTVYQFTMPAAATTVSVVFSKIEVPSATGYVNMVDSFGTTPTSNKAATASKTYSFGASNNVFLTGWSVHEKGLSSFFYKIDSGSNYSLTSQTRDDVIKAYPKYNKCTAAKVGFTGTFNSATLLPGNHTVAIYGKTTDGTTYTVATLTLKISEPSFTYYNTIDYVGGNLVSVGGSKAIVQALASQAYNKSSGGFNVTGWAVSTSGIKGFRYGFDNSSSLKNLTASFRQDVYNATKGIAPGCTSLNAFSGTISTAGLSKGTHTCQIQGITASGTYFPIATITVTIS